MVCNLVLYSLQALHILSLLIEDPHGQHRVYRKDFARRPFYHCLMMTFWCQISRKGTLMVFTNRQLGYSLSWKMVMPPDWCFRRLSQVLMESCVISAFEASHHSPPAVLLLALEQERERERRRKWTQKHCGTLLLCLDYDRPADGLADRPLRIRMTAWLLTLHPTSFESVNAKSSPTVCNGTDIDTHVLLTRSDVRNYCSCILKVTEKM